MRCFFYLAKLNFGDLAQYIFYLYQRCTRVLFGGHLVNRQIAKLKQTPSFLLRYTSCDVTSIIALSSDEKSNPSSHSM